MKITRRQLRIIIKEELGRLWEQAKDLACPAPTQDLELNTRNRNSAIKADYIQYGPLNLSDESYWKDYAKKWNTSPAVAKKSNCSNCVAFDISPRMLECMPGPTSQPIKDDEGYLGYCWMHNFKCHSARTCYTWAAGGPIKEDKVSYDWQSRNTKQLSEKYAGYHPEESYEEGTLKNLMLDKEIKALPSTHSRVKGKDVPVNKQIADWLKSMKMVKK